ncbi:hypothetical protein [Longimicrobium sp.]|uniref:hypothetical protein n=1 Tax=Longimicrobium sp. TaxID=2029185 RepID=UPI002E31741E|nr:hypothetical protein [Longimicrobium sp.]HEX6038901.1 hypothetical protein [Longimicrobium sp.]
MRKLLGLAHEVAEIARRIDRMEQWQDGHEAEDRKAHERLVIVEQQYKAVRESQGRSEGMLKRVLDLLETDLKETKRRLLDLERQLQDRGRLA